MEPKPLAPNPRLEQSPRQAEIGRHETMRPAHETANESGVERASEKRPELGAAQTEAQQAALPAFPAPVVPVADDATGASATTLSSDDIPALAGDDDLIEKEWVDKAKKILAETRDDPYRREQEVGKLQIEYIRKRYGREIGSVGDE